MVMLTNSKGFYNNDPNGGIFYGLINGGYFRRQQSSSSRDLTRNPSFRTDQDGDKTLLLWQMAAQQDAASLAEETKFLKIITNNHTSRD